MSKTDFHLHAPLSSPCLSLTFTSCSIWVTLREKTFNHCSTSNSPEPSGTPSCNKGEGGEGVETAGWKITIAHRAGQWKSFPLDFLLVGEGFLLHKPNHWR